jgi:hypothetical protein
VTPNPSIKWPSASEYSDAIQNPQNCFANSELQSGKAVTNALGVPVCASGNFAVVYPFQALQTNYAVRCFIRAVVDQQQRYEALSRHLEGFSLEALVKFEYLERGIRVGGQFRPIVKMEWASGVPLGLYVEKHFQDSAALSNLARKWRGVVAGLSGARIAHNDLQHGNILVGDHQQIRLVDYDGFYLRALAGRPPGEKGHPAYQHPERLKTSYFEENADAFPALVIYTSLLALANDPSLKQFYTGENLIFRQTDFERPGETPVWQALQRSSSLEVQRLARTLEEACKRPLATLEDLETVVQSIPTPARRRAILSTGSPQMATRLKSRPVRVAFGAAVILLAVLGLVARLVNHATALSVPVVGRSLPVAIFDATPRALTAGQSTLLHWSVKDAFRVSITPTPGVVPSDGSAYVTPLETATYKLIAEGTGGSTQASVQIEVAQPPPVANVLPSSPQVKQPKQPEVRPDFSAKIAQIEKLANDGQLPAALAASENLLKLHRDSGDVQALRRRLLAARDLQVAAHLAKAKEFWKGGLSKEALAECDEALKLDQTNSDASSLRERFTKALVILNGTKTLPINADPTPQGLAEKPAKPAKPSQAAGMSAAERSALEARRTDLEIQLKKYLAELASLKALGENPSHQAELAKSSDDLKEQLRTIDKRLTAR